MSQAAEQIARQFSSDAGNRRAWYNVIYNVKDPAYGAKGDGLKDDTAAIQGAINTASDEGGGIIFLPPGSYLVSSTIKILKNNVMLVGSGRGASRIVGLGATSPVLQVGGPGSNVARFSLKDFTVSRSLGTASKTETIGFHYVKSFHPDVCTIENVSFNGSQYNVQLGTTADRPEAFTLWSGCEFGNYDQADGYAMYVVDAIEQKFVGCRFQGFNEVGFYVPSSPTSGNPNDFEFSDCYFGSVTYSFGGSGGNYDVRIRGGFGYFFNNCIFEQGKEANVSIEAGKIFKFVNCLCGGGGYSGNGYVIFGGVATVSTVSIVGGEIRDIGQPNSNYPGTGRCLYTYQLPNPVTDIILSGVNIRSDASQAIRSDSKHVIISGCTIFQNSDFTAVLITANADFGVISGNSIKASAIVTASTSPIVLSSGSGAITVVGNSILKGGATNGITNSGDASNVVANNAIV